MTYFLENGGFTDYYLKQAKRIVRDEDDKELQRQNLIATSDHAKAAIADLKKTRKIACWAIGIAALSVIVQIIQFFIK